MMPTITDVQFLIVLWIPICIIGLAVALRNMLDAVADKSFLRAHNLNGVRVMLVDVNFSEAFSHFVFKLVYGLLGVWIFAARLQTPTPITPIGWLIFLTFFLPVLWFTATDVRNHRKKQRIVQGFVKETVEFVKVQIPALPAKENSG